MRTQRRLHRERATVLKMIALYCRGHHDRTGDSLCSQCNVLKQYVLDRLERCPFGEGKPACDDCPIHCYRADVKEQIKRVMRYSGPRMFLRHPVLTLHHFIDAHRVASEIERSGT